MCIAAPNSRRYIAPNLFGVTGNVTRDCGIYQNQTLLSNNSNPSLSRESSTCQGPTSSLSPNLSSQNAVGAASPYVSSTDGSSVCSQSVSVASAPAPLPREIAPAAAPVTAAQFLSTHFPAPPRKRRRRAPQPPGKTATDKERLFVKHNYHDLADQPDTPVEEIKDDAKEEEEKQIPVPLSPESFPMKLHRILDQIESDGMGKIVSWQPHGRAFVIRDTSLFVKIIMPRYFPRVKKLTSLQRQFNLYGFERLTREGPDEGAYYHECFLRGRPGLSANRMVRKRVKGTGYKAASNPAGEPDFYSMPFVSEVAKKNPHLFGNTEADNLEIALSTAKSSFSVLDNVTLSPSSAVQNQRLSLVGSQFGLSEDLGTVTELPEGVSVVTGSSTSPCSIDQNQRVSWSTESMSSDGSMIYQGEMNNQWQNTMAKNNFFPMQMQGSTFVQGLNLAPFTNSMPPLPQSQFSFPKNAVGGACSFSSDNQEALFPYNVVQEPIAPVPLARPQVEQQQPSSGTEDQSILMEFLDLWETADAVNRNQAFIGGK